MPSDYVNWLLGFVPPPTDENPIGDNAVLNARDGKAIGVAISNEFGIMNGRVPTDSQLISLSRAFQNDPHAIAAPEWSSRSGVEGRWAPRDVTAQPRIERAIENGITALASGIVDKGGEYGMWIYADVHDMWLPHRGDPTGWGVPQLHRVWQASHYRNVWANWFLYLRSGLSAVRLWARATSDHYLNVSTVHHVEPAVRGGKHVGDMYHCYATTPWGGESDLFGHYVDPDAHRLRGLLQHDDYALVMYQAWFSSLLALNPGNFGYGRDAINTFGAVVSYYMHSQDPNALLLLHGMANVIFEAYWDVGLQQFRFAVSPNPGDHPVWHRQCYANYHELTRDPRAVQFVTDWLAAGYGGVSALSVSAFAYSATRNSNYLSRITPDVRDAALLYHDAPVDRYHGYGPAVAVNNYSYFFQEAPYFLWALAEAGVVEPAVSATGCCYPSVHWTSFFPNLIAVRAYVLVSTTAQQFTIRLESVRHRNVVEQGQCGVFRWSGGSTGAWLQDRVVPYTQDPGVVNITVENGNIETLYRIDIASTESEFLAPFTDFPEVIEIQQMHFNGAEWLYFTHGWGRQSFWLDWQDNAAFPTAELGVGGEGAGGYYNQPSFVRLRSAADEAASGSTVFAWAQDRQRVPLPTLRELRRTIGNPRPWHLYASSVGGPVLRLWSGPARIFLALDRDHLNRVLPRIL
jgi:hypothetical protein